MDLDALPVVHDVLISHSHYDHLDWPTIRKLGSRPRYWLPQGLGTWFSTRGINNYRELAWSEETGVEGGMLVQSVPAQHFSGRGIFDRNTTHWCGWVLRSQTRSLYFAGDTGYCPAFEQIGKRFGGFDASLIPIGAYRPRQIMKAVHVDPGEAVQIHLDVGSRQSIACHWGTFHLTDEAPEEPQVLLHQTLMSRRIPPELFRALRCGDALTI